MAYNGVNYDSLIHHDDCSPAFLETLISGSSKLLDLGCGTGRKVLRFHKKAANIHLVDNNISMLMTAQQKINALGTMRCFATLANNFYLPFENNTFSLVSCMLAPFSPAEICRVLQPRGSIFLELLGADDKRFLKSAFGKDDVGWRGILMNVSKADQEDYLRRSLSPFFNKIEIAHVNRTVEMTLDSLYQILVQTPTVRDFGKSGDHEIAANALGVDGQERSVVTIEDHRVIVKATKSD